MNNGGTGSDSALSEREEFALKEPGGTNLGIYIRGEQNAPQYEL